MALPFHPVPKPQPTLEKFAKQKAKAKDEKAFREAVIARDGYRCRACGRGVVRRLDVAENRLEVHHLRKRSTNPADRFDEANGVVVCCKCHRQIEMLMIEQVGDEQSIVTFIRRER